MSDADRFAALQRVIDLAEYHVDMRHNDPDVIAAKALLRELREAKPVAWISQKGLDHLQIDPSCNDSLVSGTSYENRTIGLFLHPPACPEGWQMVPKEPTNVQVTVMCAELPGIEVTAERRAMCRAMYRVAISAAPSAPGVGDNI